MEGQWILVRQPSDNPKLTMYKTVWAPVEREYCKVCKVLIVNDACFCEWEEEPKLRKTPTEWMAVTGIEVLDPDGWDRKSLTDWLTPITREDFIKKAMMSTCYAWPQPLHDEER